MEDRIKINDVWYVKEYVDGAKENSDSAIEYPMAFLHTKRILWRNDNYSIKATMYDVEDSNDIDSENDLSIKLTNKEADKEEEIDYLPYIKNLAVRDNKTMFNLNKESVYDLDIFQIKYLLRFIDYLVQVKWIKL